MTAELSQNAVYEITRATKADEGSYSCSARNKAGLTEDRVQLIVEESNDVFDRYPERGDITGEDPGSYGEGEPIVVNVGGTAELRCDLRSDSSNIFIKWRRSSGELPQTSSIFEGSLRLTNVQEEDAGLYVCEGYDNSKLLFRAPARLVVNGVYTFYVFSPLDVYPSMVVKSNVRQYLISSAFLYKYFTGPPRIQLHPQHQVVRPGESARVHCRVVGSEPHTIMWTVPGKESFGNRALPGNAVDQNGILEVIDIFCYYPKYVKTAAINFCYQYNSFFFFFKFCFSLLA